MATLATSSTITGVAFNGETDKAVLVDTAPSSSLSIFNALDQTSTAAQFGSPLTVGNVAAAFNPLANIAVVVNNLVNEGIVVDPTAPSSWALRLLLATARSTWRSMPQPTTLSS